MSPRVFSTKGAVYVAVSSKCNDFDRGACNAPPGSSFGTERLYRNDGNGWARIFERFFQPVIGGAPASITGYSDGRIVLGSRDACPVTMIDAAGSESCLWTGVPFDVSAVTVSGDSHLFALGTYCSDVGTSALWDCHDGESTLVQSWTNAGLLGPLVASSSRVLLVYCCPCGVMSL